ncbi:MAG: alpha/beta hydrolase [Clostridia bacterium]|nr:alpha/beta hydrolase [Clostridia bacterium]
MSHEHIKIYSKVPYNTGLSKYPDLTPYREDWTPADALECSFNPEKRRNDMLGPNTAQRKLYIPRGFVSDKYDDEPYIVPFIAKGSRKAVLVVAGGAYQDVSLDGEGYPTCEYLQSRSVSAFALKYRVYPYKYPCAQLDLRRALCYIKYHAGEFGIDPDMISVIGFSAGGNLVGLTTYLFREMPEVPGYEKDEIDLLDPVPATIGVIYPELCADKFLMSLQFGERIFSDKEFCEKTLKETYVPEYVKEGTPPVFMCCCNDDSVVSPENILNMADACLKNNVVFEVHMFSEGGHGFGATQTDIPPMFGIPGRRMAGTKEWISLYVTWLDKVLTREDRGGR